MLTEREAVKQCAIIWTELSINGNPEKPDTRFLYDCPCCHYVVEKGYGEPLSPSKAFALVAEYRGSLPCYHCLGKEIFVQGSMSCESLPHHHIKGG